MAHVLLAWELGAGHGHLAPMRAIANELRRHGHDCSFAVRELGAALSVLGTELGPVWQAPVRIGRGRSPVRVQLNYASMLHNIGFDDPVYLAGRLKAWRDLMGVRRTDLVIALHSPLALIAARSLQLPRSYVGTGFCVPPLTQPFPLFVPETKSAADVLARNEASVLEELNQALHTLGQTALGALQDIFRDASPGLFTWPELDVYQVPRQERHRGVPDFAAGEPPAWPAFPGPKVFAYLRPSVLLPAVITALHKSRANVLIRAAGVPAAAFASYQRAGFTVTERSVDFVAAARQCDALVNYGGSSTIAEFLLAGKPMLLLPETLEQQLGSARAAQLGAAIVLLAKDTAVEPLLERLLSDGALAAAAQRFATRYRDWDRAGIIPSFVRDCLAVANPPSRAASAGA